jgi:signal-transduction protein with cAMP-binding, CBS, and nucleotidyltransferase domain
MSHLFTVENNIAIPNTETLLISPFKEVWERDKSKDKGQAIKEFTFVELMSSKKKANPYSGYSDDTRFEKLKEALFDDDWKPDNLIEQCLAKINEFQKEASPTYSYYLSVIEAAEKMKNFFMTFDINERNDKGIPIYKPGEITRALNDTDRVLQNLNSMKDKVEQELFEATKTKANKTINHFER